MKHDIKVTLILVAIFLITQMMGLFILQTNMRPVMNETTGDIEGVTYADSGYNKNLHMENSVIATTLASIMIGILVGTGLVLLLARFKKPHVWKSLFVFVVMMGLYKAFVVLLGPHMAIKIAAIIAIILAAGLAIWKTFWPNPIVHNLTEIFLYGGIATILVQVLNIYIAALLLVIISIYDMIAVWQSKHMIKLAQFQMSTKAFAGLSIPYKLKSEKPKVETTSLKRSSVTAAAAPKMIMQESKTAILGGGDMAFPLFFAGVLLETNGFVNVLVIPVCAAIALLLLLLLAKKDRFYPAMPFITAGCFTGWGIMALLASLM